LDIKYVEYYYQLFAVNHIIKEEIDILFQFFNSLIDRRKKTHQLSEESFRYLFYDVLLRLEVKEITPVIYLTIKNYLFFVNAQLKLINFGNNNFELVDKSILGYDVIFNILL